MLLCHCAAVSDRAVRAAIDSGARGEEEVAQHCGAATRCGGCLPALRRMLDEHHRTTDYARADVLQPA